MLTESLNRLIDPSRRMGCFDSSKTSSQLIKLPCVIQSNKCKAKRNTRKANLVWERQKLYSLKWGKWGKSERSENIGFHTSIIFKRVCFCPIARLYIFVIPTPLFLHVDANVYTNEVYDIYLTQIWRLCLLLIGRRSLSRPY